MELVNIAVGQYTLQLNDGCGNYTSQNFQVWTCSQLSDQVTISTTDLCYNFSGSGGAAYLNFPEGYTPQSISWSTGAQDVESIFGIHSTEEQMVSLNFGSCTIQKEYRLSFVRDFNLEENGFIKTSNRSMCSNLFNGKPEIYLITTSAFSPVHNPYTVTWPDGQETIFDVVDGVPVNTTNWRSFFVEEAGTNSLKIENGLGCAYTHAYDFGTEVSEGFLFDVPRSVVDLDLYSDVVPSGSAIVGKRACTECGLSIFRNCIDRRYNYEPLDPYDPCGGGTIKVEGGGFVAFVPKNTEESQTFLKMSQLNRNTCEVPCHCIFDNLPQHDGLPVMVETIAKLPPDQCTCTETFLREDEINCSITEICEDNDKVIQVTDYLYDFCYIDNGDNECQIFKFCPYNSVATIHNSAYSCENPQNYEPCGVGLKLINDNILGGAIVSTNEVIFPNPFIGDLSVHYTLPEAGLVDISLENSLGQSVLSQRVSGVKGNNEVRLKVDEAIGGVYLLSIRTDSERRSYTLLKVDGE